MGEKITHCRRRGSAFTAGRTAGKWRYGDVLRTGLRRFLRPMLGKNRPPFQRQRSNLRLRSHQRTDAKHPVRNSISPTVSTFSRNIDGTGVTTPSGNGKAGVWNMPEKPPAVWSPPRITRANKPCCAVFKKIDSRRSSSRLPYDLVPYGSRRNIHRSAGKSFARRFLLNAILSISRSKGRSK